MRRRSFIRDLESVRGPLTSPFGAKERVDDTSGSSARLRLPVTRFVTGVEQLIVVVLLVLLAVALAAGTAQLVVSVVLDSVHRWNEVHTIDELAELRAVFSGFLLILI